MITVLVLFAMLSQVAAQAPSKPVIDNERVSVWDVTTAVPAQPMDAVVVSLSGNAVWTPKGTPPKIDGPSIIIDLKDHPVAPIANPTKYPLAFPRPGAKKLLENDRVIVWESTWKPGVPSPMHFHDKDVVVVFVRDGDLTSTTPDGRTTLNKYTSGTVRFNARNRTHYETAVSGNPSAIITELK